MTGRAVTRVRTDTWPATSATSQWCGPVHTESARGYYDSRHHPYGSSSGSASRRGPGRAPRLRGAGSGGRAMNADDLRAGMRVMVRLGGSRDDREARVVKAPPYTETVGGEERRHTDKALVEYPDSGMSRRSMFGNMRENVDIDSLEPVDG